MPADPLWIPPFVRCSVTFGEAPVVVPATFERPRGATRYGTVSVWTCEPAVGVATTSPRTVSTPPGPITNVSSLGIAVNAPLAIESETVAVAVRPAGTVTLLGETLTLLPSCPPFATVDRLYAAV